MSLGLGQDLAYGTHRVAGPHTLVIECHDNLRRRCAIDEDDILDVTAHHLGPLGELQVLVSPAGDPR